ncbi:hypothetical protein F5879DRAFT_740446 [Lentinula edodes]|uniref:uncharacterized protein n=1 Tax=Lentinula edodes TaxID=5353 RepID=UPI001E8EAAA4|nr:uncharacterized protein C8R40DRAFT_259698 [Lentinula edodes]KAH7880557.1 hypothetical protein C8R40DRAFT_259698 [Lentinula edodes]KAJ3905476.1 hypothetical protein F5879DRAFT_740446 [Lentinula edodes]
MTIFQGIHFYLHPEILPEVQNTLRQSIAELGGQVDGNVPDRGYVLADLHNPESQRAFQLFSAERWVVPLTFVEACKTAGAHIAPIFLESEGRPMPIHVHESIANVKFREALYEKILYCAGFPYASLESARVIIADSKTDVFNALVKHYQLTPHKYIESLEWVDRCIERQGVSFTPHVFKNPGGRRAGEERTQFTEEDEQKLCEWIAAKIPFKSTGGRTGNKLYQQLCEMSNHPEYSWVTRHTWQSWRERYKKNAGRLDKIVDKIVSTTKPNQGEKWQYGYVRQDDDKPKKKRKRLSKHEDGQEFVVGSSSAGQESVHADPHVAANSSLGQLAGILRLAPPGNREDEWRIRDGHDPPPAWAKSRGSNELEEGPNVQCAKSEEPPTITDDTLQLAITVAVAGHVLEQELSEIALQTRFTVEEVREYYDKYGGDLERTSRRLQKMREHLNALPDDD